jgi:hypothetical protein
MYINIPYYSYIPIYFETIDNISIMYIIDNQFSCLWF